MRAVVQRVARARVVVGGRSVGEIARGLLVLLGVGRDDTVEDVRFMVGKIANLRVFEAERGSPDVDSAPPGRMDRSVLDIGGGVLVVSQFTLYGDCRKGRRPSFDAAGPPALARALYEDVVRGLRDQGLFVATGRFQAMMEVELVNDGPVTLMLDSRRVF